MRYRVIKNGNHPITNQPIKQGQIIDIFHQIGDEYCGGENPLFERTRKIDKSTAIALEHQIREEYELPENTNEREEDFLK